jgi:tRNA dimethylallyltransferase
VTPVVILGPTASGKSDVSMHVAREGGVQIVAVDAMQVYRGMDIGTAKPSRADREAVAHHCIDLVDPTERFTVTQYKAAATAALDAIASVGDRAVLVAGTGLYLTAVIDDLTPPGEWPEVRAELAGEADVAALWARLVECDPVTAQRTDRHNRRRIERALEVTIGSGRPFSSFGPGTGAYPDNGISQIGILWPRDLLARRIEARVHAMIAAGLLAEVRGLYERRALSREAQQALGYKELIDHLEGRTGFDEAVATIVTRTRQFAVRQERWFRRDPRVQWVTVDADPIAEVTPALRSALQRVDRRD